MCTTFPDIQMVLAKTQTIKMKVWGEPTFPFCWENRIMLQMFFLTRNSLYRCEMRLSSHERTVPGIMEAQPANPSPQEKRANSQQLAACIIL